MAVAWDSVHDPLATAYLGYPDYHDQIRHRAVHHHHYPNDLSTLSEASRNETHIEGGTVSWTPDSDIRETKIAYHIDMELAGVSDKKAVSIQWMSPRTILVEGKSFRPDLCRGHEGDGEAMWESELVTNGVDNGSETPKNDQDGGPIVRCPDTAEERTTRLMRAERKIGTWCRSFTLPIDVDMKTVKARLEFGLLHISVFKKKMSSEPLVKVEIE